MGPDLLQLFGLLLLCGCAASVGSSDCKSYDERTKGAGKSQPSDKKVVCSSMELHQVLPADSFPNRTVTIILNNNKIQELRNGSFFGLSTLEKLDLRSNMISRIEPGAFLGLSALKKLDLSNNSIGCLNEDIFKGLSSLIRLNLSGNKFSSLSQGTFDSLVSLKALEFQTPYLLCDCNLLWLLRWIKEKNIVVKNTKCSYPQSLQADSLSHLSLVSSDAPLELPSFQLTPSQRQVVFQGDSLPFQCQASFVAEDMQVLWYQNGRMVKPDAAQGIFIEKRMVQNCSLIASALTISNIQPGFTGNWECRVRTSRGNTTRTVHIVVLESSAKYCAPERISNNKGDFRWPRTLAGIKAYLPCNKLATSAGSYSGSSGEEQRAWRYCDRDGLWAEEDYSRCQFQKDVTRFLYVINQMPLNESNVVPRAQRLLVCTVDAANFSDKMDIIFVAEMIEKFGKFVEKFKDLGEVMVSMASNLMLADERVLWMAQREAMACSRIIACLQKIADLSSVEYFSPSIQPLHPVIYATSIILLLCLLTIIISYIYHHKSVRVSCKFWHMLINLCFHISLTCGVFVGGINQTRYASVCQAVGILLHYSTLATALWVGVTARNIYKQVTRKAKRYEELDEPPPPPRPMLRFYLIGGGIPIIVCGITAAANIKNYGSRTSAPYCWMAWEPSIGAFYGPVGFIIFVDCMYFLSILLQLRRHPERRYEFKELTEEQQHLAEVGPDGPGSHCQPLTLQLQPHEVLPSIVSAPHTVPLSALENEHTFAAQLIGAAGALGLYAALWVFGAMAVSQDHPYDLAFTCLYGVAALALGAFMVAHHCVNRQDMRRYWSQACCSGRRAYSAQEDVLLPQSGVAMTSTAGSANKADGESTKCGHSSADSSYTNKSAPSVRHSTHGSKLTNLHAEAAQCKPASAPATANGAAVLDNSLTEHSLDNEIKMHVAPVEVQFHPMNNVNNPTAAANGHAGRHHKNRARAHRASRLTVLREYAYDVPTSVDSSVQSRHQSQMQQDSSDSMSLPRRSRYSDKGGSDTPGNGAVVTIETERGTATAASSSSKDSAPAKQSGSNTELENLPKSYGLNLVTQNGSTLKENGQAVPLINAESVAGVKTGLWKHETTV
uniref:Adhesion G protein-coupled receptor A3 n=1 Tax=Anabas testudineus TaxID=64144 RepID=A0A7N6BJ89_ANATE